MRHKFCKISKGVPIVNCPSSSANPDEMSPHYPLIFTGSLWSILLPKRLAVATTTRAAKNAPLLYRTIYHKSFCRRSSSKQFERGQINQHEWRKLMSFVSKHNKFHRPRRRTSRVYPRAQFKMRGQRLLFSINV